VPDEAAGQLRELRYIEVINWVESSDLKIDLDETYPRVMTVGLAFMANMERLFALAHLPASVAGQSKPSIVGWFIPESPMRQNHLPRR
jgi:hypothetical protein